MEPVERSKLQPAVSDALEPLGSSNNVFDDLAAETFDELDQPVYEDLEDSKQMSGLEYRVEEIHEIATEIRRTVDATQRKQPVYQQKISETITLSLEPVHKMLAMLAERMTIIEDKMDRLIAVGVALQSGTEPVMPVKKPVSETTQIINQIVTTPLSGELIDEIMNGSFGRA